MHYANIMLNYELGIRNNKFLISFCILLLSFYFVNAQCGEHRWDVKTLSDSDTLLIDFNKVVKTTILEQSALPKPEKIKHNTPRQSSEITVYSIDCEIVSFKREDDFDIHIVLKDPKGDLTMVAELPSPWCPEVQATSRSKVFKKINDFFLDNIGKPTSKFKNLRYPIPVRVTGVGFFDAFHGQRGMLSNGREIHPVLKIELLK
jgi:hypothetical protein